MTGPDLRSAGAKPKSEGLTLNRYSKSEGLTLNRYSRSLVFDPEQPEDGVTLPSGTPTAEIAHFCEMYDAADENGRTLLRQQAETLCNVNGDIH